jgi:predicted DNA-binding ribbon-helix-helix protein
MPGLKKRSISLAGHATSVALEPEFWAILEEICNTRGLSMAAFIAELDKGRGESLLASYCRLTALKYAIERPIEKNVKNINVKITI